MIKSFTHKGLEKFFRTDSVAGIQAKHEKRLRLILTSVDAASELNDLSAATFRLHSLKGQKQHLWSVTVNGNWRVVFRFEGGDAYIVDYLDYH